MTRIWPFRVSILIVAVVVCIYGSRQRLLATDDALVTVASSHFQVIDLGTLPTDNWSEANSINDKGQVLCTAGIRKDYDPNVANSRAFLWEQGRQRDLGTLAHSPDTQGIAINNRSQILGKALLSSFSFSPFRVFLWQDGSLRDLPTLSLPGIEPMALSDASEIVGGVARGATISQQKAFVWKNGKFQSLGLPLGSVANDINHSDAAHPFLLTGEVQGTGFLWRNGQLLKMRMAGTWGVHLHAVNASGQSVGGVDLTTGHSHALLWQKGKITDLGTLAARHDSMATAINRESVVVGWATTSPDSLMHAVLWRGKAIQDLNNEIRTIPRLILSSAKGINNHGQIICDGFLADAGNNEHQHAYLLTPR